MAVEPLGPRPRRTKPRSQHTFSRPLDERNGKNDGHLFFIITDRFPAKGFVWFHGARVQSQSHTHEWNRAPFGSKKLREERGPVPRRMAASLPQRLEDSAANVGYTGRIRGVPREVLRNRKLLHFLQWAVERLEPANCLSQAQLEKWVELHRSLVTQSLSIVCMEHKA